MKIYRSRKYKKSDSSTRRIAAYIATSIILILILVVWGVTLLANLSNFWDSLRGSSVATPSATLNPPAPPRLSGLPAYTNQTKVNIRGNAEPGTTVTLFRNGSELDNQLAGNDSQFNFHNVTLQEGTNTFTAKAKSGPGLESHESGGISVVLDTVSPKLTITTPEEKASTTSQFVTVSGKSEPKTVVTINDQQQIVGVDGSFSGVATMTQAGANTITIVATDLAGNQAKVTRTITYSP